MRLFGEVSVVADIMAVMDKYDVPRQCGNEFFGPTYRVERLAEWWRNLLIEKAKRTNKQRSFIVLLHGGAEMTVTGCIRFDVVLESRDLMFRDEDGNVVAFFPAGSWDWVKEDREAV